MLVFDRNLVCLHRDRAAKNFAQHRTLWVETGGMLADRLMDVRRDFESVLDVGAHDGILSRLLPSITMTSLDSSAKMLAGVQNAKVCDEEFLPFPEKTFDLVLSNGALHWINDLPGVLTQIYKILKSGGLFLGAMPGENTLWELRQCLMQAEENMMGGVSPRFSPTITMPSASQLLQRAGFSLPVVDKETVTLTYSNIFALMHDLRGMGQTNAHIHRSRIFTPRRVFLEAGRLYQEQFALPNGQIPATFEIIFLHGWRE